MRRLYFCFPLILLLSATTRPAHAEISVWCGNLNNEIYCTAGLGQTFQIADRIAQNLCIQQQLAGCQRMRKPDNDACVAVARSVTAISKLEVATGPTVQQARKLAVDGCLSTYGETCISRFGACDSAAASHSSPLSAFLSQSSNIGAGLFFGLGIVLALGSYALRAAIFNFVIHGNLPPKLPVYGDDIQVLFKRTQRVNWYGRIVFGIIAQLAMDHKQYSLVRRYWLGRVIAFDSLRRQRQNELARMHLHLAASAKVEAKDKKALAQLWAALKYVVFVVFYLIRAAFSFLFGFLFIRVNIAKLVRGKLIESKDLVLVLQAKEAIEETAKYLKEYLTTAETFDGREELFESK